jgi:hypothetical protein
VVASGNRARRSAASFNAANDPQKLVGEADHIGDLAWILKIDLRLVTTAVYHPINPEGRFRGFCVRSRQSALP